MFKPDSKFFDDLAKMAGGTVGLMASLRAEITEDIKERFEAMASRMDLVPREDFERLEARVAALEAALKEKSKKDGIKSAGDSAAKTSRAKPKSSASQTKTTKPKKG
ncbi:MAG: accessory factor UbiK family protein [Pseudobdellovibrionaceae bacterium]